LAFLATATGAVHHRCITSTAFGAFRGIADRRETGWLSQIRRPDDSWGEESGLEVC
jgi:hypothetical protein